MTQKRNDTKYALNIVAKTDKKLISFLKLGGKVTISNLEFTDDYK